MPDVTNLLLDHIHSSLNQTEKFTVALLQNLKSHVAQYKKNSSDQPLFSRFLGLNYLLIFLFFPCYLFYWCYIYPTYFVYCQLSKYLRVPIKILRRRSFLLNSLICHVHEILSIAHLILEKIVSSKISELLAFCISAAIEISLAMIWPFQQQQQQSPVAPTSPIADKPSSEEDISELVRYEELSPDENSTSSILSKKTRNMHNVIPLNPFRATVRVRKSSQTAETSESSDNIAQKQTAVYQRGKTHSSPTHEAAANRPPSPPSTTKTVVKLLKFLKKLPSSFISLVLEEAAPSSVTFNSSNAVNVTDMDAFSVRAGSPEDDLLDSIAIPDIDIFNIDSPASFPSSPFSRAYVMNRASERVVSVMFAARDRLRLEAQSVSRDEYSRMAAREAQTRGQYAVFDTRQLSAGIALTCSNHCAVKVGKGLVSSCRAMIPVRPNAFVYFEFSVTVSSNQSPHLAIGIAPLDSPLNVMVGSWTRSVGLYYDGQIMVGSRWFPPVSQQNQHLRQTAQELRDGNVNNHSNNASTGDRIVAGSTVGILVYLPGIHESAFASNPISTISHEHFHPEITCPPMTRDRSISNSSATTTRSRTVSMAAATAVQLSHPLVQFNINGHPVTYNETVYESFKELSGTSESPVPPLFPTVSLFSEDTRVWCRFCEADIVYRDRTTIRAPPGARVYCLDGSLLLSERE